MAFNMRPTKNPMPSQDPNVRNKNFLEVATGYTEEMAIDEAKRCLNCKNKPCVAHCPVNINIPEFISQVAIGEFEKAYEIISESSSLPAVCGRVCPQETQCEMKCTRGLRPGSEPVAIGRLERFVADYHNSHFKGEPKKVPSNGHKVWIIGSGPSGLTCAGDLAKKGYDVTIFEALHLAGGVLVYGIPEFRLPKDIVRKEVDNLKALGVKVETNMVIGKVISIDELINEYGFEAIFIGSGAGLPRFMGIPGENLKGVYSANEFLTRTNLNIPNGTILMISNKDNQEEPWMIYYLEDIKASGYNRYIMLKMTHYITWKARDNKIYSSWAYLYGQENNMLKDELQARSRADARYTENLKTSFFILPINEHIRKDDYLVINENTPLEEAYVVTGYDINSTKGVEYITIDPVYIRDKNPDPIKTETDSNEDFFWIEGGI